MLLVVLVILKNELKVMYGVFVGISFRSNWYIDLKELDLIIKF